MTRQPRKRGWALHRVGFDAIADEHRGSAPDLRIGITPASITGAPQNADAQRLT